MMVPTASGWGIQKIIQCGEPAGSDPRVLELYERFESATGLRAVTHYRNKGRTRMKEERISTDILCADGGIAGLMAAIRTAELGAQVVVAEKVK